MAAASLLTLLDDIATLLDDIALMTKVATQKTAGVLGDDLAVNAEQLSGMRASRELPVVWAVAKGSLKNKCILVPAALLVSAVAAWLITPILMLGGAYLCYEGFEKICHGLQRKKHKLAQAQAANARLNKAEMLNYEQDKIKGAIRTDLVLSAEIIVIALGTVQDAGLAMQAVIISTVAIAITLGVYGLVAIIVKLDDAGFYLLQQQPRLKYLGHFLVKLSPLLMRILTIVGTAAMFLVGGSIIMHGLPALEHGLQAINSGLSDFLWPVLATALVNLLVGLVVGAITVTLFVAAQKIRGPGENKGAA
ncbi:DUF808 domain-containing protein [Dasania marina]|uniref:DUF808 domain-containing protein n=1 Tax=Dasania marina TaxID=471499 RepID=UPI00036B1AE0|nr:DUF808 domain-containing protein [Dasania marina]